MTEINANNPAAGDSQEHIDAMVAKAAGAKSETGPAPVTADVPAETPATDTPADRPAWLPEGFDTPEQLAEAYKATQTKPDDAAKGATDEAAAKAVETAGLDMAALETKLTESGKLDDSDYEALSKAGITKEMADTYIAGQQALGTAMVSRMYETVGGEAQFNQIVAWAAKEMPQDEVAAFNKLVDTADEGTLKLALQGLAAKYTAAGRKAPGLIGGAPSREEGSVFRSVSEMTAAMRDPRYAQDPAYRADVEARLSRSNIF